MSDQGAPTIEVDIQMNQKLIFEFSLIIQRSPENKTFYRGKWSRYFEKLVVGFLKITRLLTRYQEKTSFVILR